MAPLDLDKYVEIARLCKYLPENDLKVSSVRGCPACEVNSFRLWGSRRPAFLSPRDPCRVPGPVVVAGRLWCDTVSRGSQRSHRSQAPPNAVLAS
jgi:hypothetical protein